MRGGVNLARRCSGRGSDIQVEASETGMRLVGRHPWHLCNCGMHLALAGRADEARAMVDELIAGRAKEHVPPLAIAWVCLKLGDRDDPRFVDLARRIGIPAWE